MCEESSDVEARVNVVLSCPTCKLGANFFCKNSKLPLQPGFRSLVMHMVRLLLSPHLSLSELTDINHREELLARARLWSSWFPCLYGGQVPQSLMLTPFGIVKRERERLRSKEQSAQL